MIKFNKLLHTTTDVVYYENILPTIEQRKFLTECRNDIRDYLRPRLKQSTVSVLNMEKPVEPKFRDQGSWSYKTCIQPAYYDSQQMDWDFGVYLPISVWEENGLPKLMAKAYFELVENMLQGLCNEKKWHLLPGKNNSNCIRIEVSNWAHIDLTLYVAPEKQFIELVEKVEAKFAESRFSLDSINPLSYGEMSDQSWDDMDGIFMATRLGNWKKSDPYAVTRWFKDRILEQESNGEQLRRICRYLKAWRDYQWKEGKGPSSILLMLCAVENFKGVSGRDDLAFEAVAKMLPEFLENDVYCEAIDGGEENFNRLGADDRQKASSLARDLHSALRNVRQSDLKYPHHLIQMIIDKLGDRVPNKPHLLELDNGSDTIRNTPAKLVSPPFVPSNKAG